MSNDPSYYREAFADNPELLAKVELMLANKRQLQEYNDKEARKEHRLAELVNVLHEQDLQLKRSGLPSSPVSSTSAARVPVTDKPKSVGHFRASLPGAADAASASYDNRVAALIKGNDDPAAKRKTIRRGLQTSAPLPVSQPDSHDTDVIPPSQMAYPPLAARRTAGMRGRGRKRVASPGMRSTKAARSTSPMSLGTASTAAALSTSSPSPSHAPRVKKLTTVIGKAPPHWMPLSSGDDAEDKEVDKDGKPRLRIHKFHEDEIAAMFAAAEPWKHDLRTNWRNHKTTSQSDKAQEACVRAITKEINIVARGRGERRRHRYKVWAKLLDLKSNTKNKVKDYIAEFGPSGAEGGLLLALTPPEEICYLFFGKEWILGIPGGKEMGPFRDENPLTMQQHYKRQEEERKVNKEARLQWLKLKEETIETRKLNRKAECNIKSDITGDKPSTTATTPKRGKRPKAKPSATAKKPLTAASSDPEHGDDEADDIVTDDLPPVTDINYVEVSDVSRPSKEQVVTSGGTDQVVRTNQAVVQPVFQNDQLAEIAKRQAEGNRMGKTNSRILTELTNLMKVSSENVAELCKSMDMLSLAERNKKQTLDITVKQGSQTAASLKTLSGTVDETKKQVEKVVSKLEVDHDIFMHDGHATLTNTQKLCAASHDSKEHIRAMRAEMSSFTAELGKLLAPVTALPARYECFEAKLNTLATSQERQTEDLQELSCKLSALKTDMARVLRVASKVDRIHVLLHNATAPVSEVACNTDLAGVHKIASMKSDDLLKQMGVAVETAIKKVETPVKRVTIVEPVDENVSIDSHASTIFGGPEASFAIEGVVDLSHDSEVRFAKNAEKILSDNADTEEFVRPMKSKLYIPVTDSSPEIVDCVVTEESPVADDELAQKNVTVADDNNDNCDRDVADVADVLLNLEAIADAAAKAQVKMKASRGELGQALGVEGSQVDAPFPMASPQLSPIQGSANINNLPIPSVTGQNTSTPKRSMRVIKTVERYSPVM